MRKKQAVKVLRELMTEIEDYERPMGLVPRRVVPRRVVALGKAIKVMEKRRKGKRG